MNLENNKDVLITLKSIQTDGKDKMETELITAGTYFKNDDGFSISYLESEATGFEGSTTLLKTQGNNQVIMERSGKASANLVIEKGKKHHCHYGTPYGDFMVGILAGDIKSTLTDQGGDLYFKYVIDINSSYISDYEMFINIK